MQITNGTFSRTYKPADYEARTCTLSFAVDPGEDVDAAILIVSAMCERHARALPAPQTLVVPGLPTAAEVAASGERIAEITGKRSRKPPVVESAARVEATEAATENPTPPATAEAAALPTTAPATDASIGADPPAKAISNVDLQEAIVATHARLAREHEELRGDDVEKRDARGFLIRTWRDEVTGVAGMPVGQMDQAQRVRFLDGLKVLKPETY